MNFDCILLLKISRLYFSKKQKTLPILLEGFSWSHLGSNQGPPDYESGALTN